jgi:magnesium-transporting ATPase (P-type)
MADKINSQEHLKDAFKDDDSLNDIFSEESLKKIFLFVFIWRLLVLILSIANCVLLIKYYESKKINTPNEYTGEDINKKNVAIAALVFIGLVILCSILLLIFNKNSIGGWIILNFIYHISLILSLTVSAILITLYKDQENHPILISAGFNVAFASLGLLKFNFSHNNKFD